MSVVEEILSATEKERKRIFAALSDEERVALNELLTLHLDQPWRRYANDPVAFVTQGLGEAAWSKQREILQSVRDHKRTAVPACHAPGKSHIAARVIAWWICSHAPGTALAVTTAPTFRQVRNILWAQIRRLVSKYDMPGSTNQTEWKIGEELVAFGFANADDEAAVQGIHAPHVLVVVDEGGGISEILGRSLEALMTGDHTRLLVVGNPPTDNEGSWFERCCNSTLYNVIPIGALDTPNFTGEDAGVCKSCPPNVPEHSVATHLVDRQWVADVESEFGEDSAFVEARVHAKFPRNSTSRVIPYSWCEMAVDNENPAEGNIIRLGVDVASDGGDELVVARADGYSCYITHRSSGAENANAVDVAEKILKEIISAEKEHEKRGIRDQVVVKIDATGMGWGVVGILEQCYTEGRHHSEIVGVIVGETAKDRAKFVNQRAEMWWAGRLMFQPQRLDDGSVAQMVRIENDRRLLAQLSAPSFGSDAAGRLTIERKKDLKRKGQPSPDRAEAVLLALYEPPSRRAKLQIPVSIGQDNPWRL
jgi:hypothetical protein